METRDTQYIHDGVYAGHDGYQIWLGANHHTNMTVALEAETFAGLIRYAMRTMKWHPIVIATLAAEADESPELKQLIENCLVEKD